MDVLRVNKMKSIFPKPIHDLPEAYLAYDGAKGYIAQGDREQVIFMEFEKDVEVPEHSHESQWEIVLEGEVRYRQDGMEHIYKKGDRFFIPKGKIHSAIIYAGYSSIVFFNQKDRYKKKE
jgi:quercetin dioxygenase-like cupin family protein